MSKIVCKCGNILCDNTDRIRYKGYVISDNEYFDLLDLADEMIEAKSLCREELAMTFRRNIGIGVKYIRLKEIYQCSSCGRIMIEITPGQFCFFAPDGNDQKDLFDYKAGERKSW